MKRFANIMKSAASGGGGGSGGVPTGLAALGIGTLGLAYGGTKSIYQVEGGCRAILFHRIGGVGKEIFTEGLHFRLPWFQTPIIYDVRTKPNQISSLTGSKDLQSVNVTLRVLSRPDGSMLPKIYQTLGTDYNERVLPSIVNEVLKSVVAKFNASQLITLRPQVSAMIREELTERAKDFYIILDDVSITDLSFSPVYTAAVEAKQVAQQEAQRAQFIVERAKQERQQKIVQAEGESEAAKLIGKSVAQNQGYLKLRRIQAAQGISRVMSNSANRMFLDANSLLLNLDSREFDEDMDKSVMKRRK
ncbi:prohibitin-2-like [Symsagittifera roscoffensis]|uniref:prohibitin-2-like n=1 Tax=Symsagittifera roscoffensis TaxID=84072 RepID=UPI00307C6908